MELSHAISDAVLTITGFFVFFRYLLKLKLPVCLTWSAFILSVTLAALFGTLRFLGVSPYAVIISEFFQHSAGTIGAFGLVWTSIFLALKKPMPALPACVVLVLGLVVLGVVQLTDNLQLLSAILTVAVPVVFLIRLSGLIKGERGAAVWLIMAVVALIVGTFNKNLVANAVFDSTDIYHYMLTVSLLCFGKAAWYQTY